MNENTTEPRVKIIENATLDDVQTGDRFVWEETWTARGLTLTTRREGIAHHRNSLGNWETADGGWLPSADGEGVTLTLRRTVQDPPTKPGSVLDPADGHKYITATHDGETWRTREAILSWSGYWIAVWRSGNRTRVAMRAENITPGTWKEDGK